MNVTALLATDGTPLERYVYDPYGKVTVLDADFSADADGKSDYDNSILFAGYYRDNETGLYHVRNRYYHTQVGWITRDPAGYADGMSLYEYCASGPWARRMRWVFARPRVRPARRRRATGRRRRRIPPTRSSAILRTAGSRTWTS